jgi:hypothetical protein
VTNPNSGLSVFLRNDRLTRTFGVAGFLLAALSMSFNHGGNLALIWIAMAASALAALGGRRAFPLAALATGATGLLVFSPITLAAIVGNARSGSWLLAFAAIVPFCFPIVAMILSGSQAAKAGPSGT